MQGENPRYTVKRARKVEHSIQQQCQVRSDDLTAASSSLAPSHLRVLDGYTCRVKQSLALSLDPGLVSFPRFRQREQPRSVPELFAHDEK